MHTGNAMCLVKRLNKLVPLISIESKFVLATARHQMSNHSRIKLEIKFEMK